MVLLKGWSKMALSTGRVTTKYIGNLYIIYTLVGGLPWRFPVTEGPAKSCQNKWVVLLEALKFQGEVVLLKQWSGSEVPLY